VAIQYEPLDYWARNDRAAVGPFIAGSYCFCDDPRVGGMRVERFRSPDHAPAGRSCLALLLAVTAAAIIGGRSAEIGSKPPTLA